MNLSRAVHKYVTIKQSMGMVFETEATILRAFTLQMRPCIAVRKITSDAVLLYLNGRGPVTRFWHRKYDALSGFWTFAIQRGYTDRSPLPPRQPKEPSPFVPHIYTHQELRRLLGGMAAYQKEFRKLEPLTFRALLLLLYGAGLRVSEAIHLTCSDVDLADATLMIRQSKFYKTRRIAISPQLHGVLAEYDVDRRRVGHSRRDDAPFFTYKQGEPVERAALEDAFLRLRQHVGVGSQGKHAQPRLHDLRHSFAVHRVIAWYRSGADVQLLLPGLATHLGHHDLEGTQRYLTMTPELLAEASVRFEKYVGEVAHE
ncbi:MAG: tyrosine-type recombinase/integrase [Terriglobia bacterium]